MSLMSRKYSIVRFAKWSDLNFSPSKINQLGSWSLINIAFPRILLRLPLTLPNIHLPIIHLPKPQSTLSNIPRMSAVYGIDCKSQHWYIHNVDLKGRVFFHVILSDSV